MAAFSSTWNGIEHKAGTMTSFIMGLCSVCLKKNAMYQFSICTHIIREWSVGFSYITFAHIIHGWSVCFSYISFTFIASGRCGLQQIGILKTGTYWNADYILDTHPNNFEHAIKIIRWFAWALFQRTCMLSDRIVLDFLETTKNHNEE